MRFFYTTFTISVVILKIKDVHERNAGVWIANGSYFDRVRQKPSRSPDTGIPE